MLRLLAFWNTEKELKNKTHACFLTGEKGEFKFMENYCLLTDAPADLSLPLAQELGIELIPMPLDIDGKPYLFTCFDDSLRMKTFYDLLREGKFAHTSQINETIYMDRFKRHLENGEDILYLCFSSGLSNTYNAACLCVEQLSRQYPDRRIVCIDTLCASSGEGLLAYTAAKKKQAGASLEEVRQWVERMRDHVCHCFKVEDLDHLRRGGRISATTAVVGSALQIKPILVVDHAGKLQNVAKMRGRKRAQEYQLSALERNLLPGAENDTLTIGHGDCQEEAEAMRDAILARCPQIQHVIILPVGAIIGTHVGPGMLTVNFYGKDKMCK